jgi:hypothetical protein
MEAMQITGHASPVVPTPKPSRQPPKTKRAGRVTPHTLTAFAASVVQAVLPLVDQGKGDRLANGYGANDVFQALVPLFGGFTVAEAVRMFELLEGPQQEINEHTDAGRDNPQTEAIYQARAILADFACCARPSSAACVAARVTMLKQGDDIGEVNEWDLADALADDIRRLSRSSFGRGERFAAARWFRGYTTRHSFSIERED